MEPGEPSPDVGPTNGSRGDGTAAGSPAEESVGLRALLDRSRDRVAGEQARLNELIERYHDHPLLDVGLRIYQRDREAAGTIVGSALAFRLFLFCVPMMLFGVGVLGFLARWVDADSFGDATGVSGSIAAQIETALEQPNVTRWVATLSGLVGMAWAGRGLSKVMVSASCLSWRLPVTTKASLRVVGSIVGLLSGIIVCAGVLNRIRRDQGLAVAGLSFVAVAALYAVAWIAISTVLPRATRDPGALLPGAVVVGAVLASLQAVSQLYLPDKLSRASQLYGALATTIVTLGWFFFVGRTMVFAMSLEAVVHERFGSISRFVFGLPIVRILPRRSAWIRKFFDLEQ